MILRTPKRRSSRDAFTLVEMLVVVAIIVVLAGIAVPITLSVLDSSKRDIAKSQCKGLLSHAVERYRMDEEQLRRRPADFLGRRAEKPEGRPQAGSLERPLGPPVPPGRSQLAQ